MLEGDGEAQEMLARGARILQAAGGRIAEDVREGAARQFVDEVAFSAGAFGSPPTFAAAIAPLDEAIPRSAREALDAASRARAAAGRGVTDALWVRA